MENITQTLTLDLVEIQHHVINARQGDRLVRDLNIIVTNNGSRYEIPDNAIVRLRGHRPDNQSIFYDGAVIDPRNGSIQIHIPDFLLSCSGRAKLDIGIYQNTSAGETEIASTESFVLYIPPSVFSEDEVVHSDHGSVLSKLIHEAQKGIEEMTNTVNGIKNLIGEKNGIAELDENGFVISSQLPSYVDDIVEGYFYNHKLYSDPGHGTEIIGETGKIYVDISGSNKIYRWSGSAFVVISDTIAIGETSSTAYRGDRGKTAYNHSQTSHAPSNAEINQNAFSNVAIGSTTVTAHEKTDTLTLTAGSNITLTPNTANNNITLSVSDTNWPVARNINGMLVQGNADRTNYGTCATAAATAEKSLACTGFSLITGAEITVKFTVTNTAANPTLNVNNTGAKPIYYRGSAIPAGHPAANGTYHFRYNGSQYEFVGDLNMSTVSVTGIKGNAESSYRTGNVNLTPANIGLGNVNNTADANKSVKYASSAGNANTLDNLHASSFMHIADGPTSAETIQTIGLDPGFHDVQDVEIGLPGDSGKYFSILNLGTYAGSGGADRTQIAFPYQESLTDTDMYIRTAKGKTWRSWRKVWHSGNLLFSEANVTIKTGTNGGSYCIPINPINKRFHQLHLFIKNASCTTTSAWITIATCSSKPSQIAEGTVRISDGGLLVSGLERCNARIDTAGNIQITTPTAFSNKNIVVDIFWR